MKKNVSSTGHNFQVGKISNFKKMTYVLILLLI